MSSCFPNPIHRPWLKASTALLLIAMQPVNASTLANLPGWYASATLMPTWYQDTDVGVSSSVYQFDNPDLSGGVAVGYNVPFNAIFQGAAEIEYTYRNTALSNIWVPGEGDYPAQGWFRTQSLMINGILLVSLGKSPYGTYTGIGAGAASSERKVDEISNESHSDYEGVRSSRLLAIQAMGGLYRDLPDWLPGGRVQLGGRFFSEGFLFEGEEGDRIQLSIDLGFRYRF